MEYGHRFPHEVQLQKQACMHIEAKEKRLVIASERVSPSLSWADITEDELQISEPGCAGSTTSSDAEMLASCACWYTESTATEGEEKLQMVEGDEGEEGEDGEVSGGDQTARSWNRPIGWGIRNPFPQRKPRPMADDRRTSVVILNVPTTYAREMVAAKLDQEGLAGAYNFLYMPVQFESGRPLGWVFLNMVNPQSVADLWQKFDGYDKWGEGHTADRASVVKWMTSHQGLQALVGYYRNSSVMHEGVPDQHRPTLFVKGMRVVFPPPTERIKAPVRRRCKTATE